jgi:hypothetical protein
VSVCSLARCSDTGLGPGVVADLSWVRYLAARAFGEVVGAAFGRGGTASAVLVSALFLLYRDGARLTSGDCSATGTGGGGGCASGTAFALTDR